MKRSLIAFILIVIPLVLSSTRSSAAAEETVLDDYHKKAHLGRVIVKFEDRAQVRLCPEGLVSLSGSDMTLLRKILSSFGDPPVEKLFTRDEAEIARDHEKTQSRSGRKLADLNSYYEMQLAPKDVDHFIQALKGLTIVQIAYPTPQPVPPPSDIPPTTPNFEPDQRYLNPAPDGIDARAAWSNAGGRGESVTIIDIEYDWMDTHEDFENALNQKLCYTPQGLYADHGTAVLGELGSGDNGYGVTGIANMARLGMVTQYPVGMSNSVARAIDCATSLLDVGDVILLEAQTGGPHGAYVPVEWNQAEYDAIAAATAKGIIVVEAAGNGSEDLDHPDFQGKFDRSVRDSGAIIVGAGAPPDFGQPDRSKLNFSTYGNRVDVQGYGQWVTTTGYGDLFTGGGDLNQYYTSTFSGTSSASPIVTGAAAALQSIHITRGGSSLEPTEIRQILTDTGTPQQDGPYPGHIGPRPDLLRAIAQLSNLYVTEMFIDDPAPYGNADGNLDPGETATVRMTIKNIGGVTAQTIAGSLTSDYEDKIKMIDHIAQWPDLSPNTSAVSLPPHHRLTVQPDAQCGTRVRLTLNLKSNPYEEFNIIDLAIGQATDTYPSSDTPIIIPKNSASGILSVINVPDTFVIQDIQATVNISHGDIGELLITLKSPAGMSVTLHNHSSAGTMNLTATYDNETKADGPGTMNDFNGQQSQGSWTLQIVDDHGGAIKAGTLNSWSLELTAVDAVRCHPLSCFEPVPQVMGDSLRLSPSGENDVQFTWSAQSGGAEYRVWRSAQATMANATMVGQTAATSLLEEGGLNDPEPLVFYQLHAFNSCNWEGP